MKPLSSRTARIGLVAACSVVVLAGAATATELPDDTLTVRAMFTDAAALIPGNEVKASGVTVGRIESIALRDGLAELTMSVERSVLPLHQDARAVITTKDVLGERYVNLDRGSPSAPPLGDPPVIPASQTDRVVDLQDVLNALDDPTATAAAGVVTAVGQGMDGRGSDIAAAIRELAPAMRQADALAKVLSEQNEVLTHLVDSAQPVAAALATDDGREVDRLVASGESMLSAVATNREAVQQALDRLPGTLADAERTLARVAGVAERSTPVLASIRPVTDDLVDISAELREFSAAADPALASLEPVLDEARRLLGEAAPLVRDLRPFGSGLVGVADAGRTLSETAVTPALGDLMEFVKGWALSTSQYDAVSHYFRAMVVATPAATAGTATGAVPAVPPSAVPELPTPHAPLGPPLGSADAEPGPTPAQPSSDGGATGLSEQQENDLLGQLLGGE